MRYKHHYFALLGGLLGLLLVFEASAEADPGSDWLRLSGFGTIGLTQGGDEILGYRRDMSREGLFNDQWTFKTDSLLGLQLDAKLTDNLDAAVQLVARDRPDDSLEESLEWAFLRYRINPDLVIRGGRMGVDMFMLSEYRNLGFAYLWARPPMEFYAPIAFDHYDGADITFSTPVGEGMLRAKLFGGVTQNTFTSQAGNVEVDINPGFGASLAWESECWQARLGIASLEFDSSIDSVKQLGGALQMASGLGWPQAAGIAEDLESEGARLHYYSAGIAYDSHPWLVQSEISFIDSDYNVFLPLLSAYLSVGQRIGPVTIYGVGALARNTESRVKVPSAPPVPPLILLQRQTQGFYNLTPIDQHSLSLGMRWDIRYDLALKAQWDHTWIDEYGGGLWLQKTPLTDDRTMDTFSINLNFVF